MVSTIHRFMLFAGLVGAVLLAAPTDARACSCLPPDLASSYNNSSDVFAGWVLARLQGGDTNYFIFWVHTTYKGCAEPAHFAILSTPADPASCGIDLQPWAYHLITAEQKVSPVHYKIGLCGYNRSRRELTRQDWQFLRIRYNCCGDECACVHVDQVFCFVDPCSVASCEEGECVANYCGGCWAEFYNEIGQAVCTPCRSDEDCSWGQVCSPENECRTE